MDDIEDQPQSGERLTVPKRNNTAVGCGCFVVLAVAVTVGIVIAGNRGGSDLSSTPPATQVAAPATTAASPAQELADLDGGKSPAADYQAALDALAPKCTQDVAHIAGLGDAGYQDLVKNGITDETRLTVLQHLSDSIPASLGKTDCTGMLSAYLVLREQG
jgi:hypothetical protein